VFEKKGQDLREKWWIAGGLSGKPPQFTNYRVETRRRQGISMHPKNAQKKKKKKGWVDGDGKRSPIRPECACSGRKREGRGEGRKNSQADKEPHPGRPKVIRGE